MTAMKGAAILFSEMTPPAGEEDAFNRWYDDHHTPSHVNGVAGFLSARRYRKPEGPNYLAVYELASVAALETPEYVSRKFTPDPSTKLMLSKVTGFTRYIALEQGLYRRPDAGAAALDAPIIHPAFFTVPAAHEQDFDDWYTLDLIPTVLGCTDWLMVRTFRIVAHDPEKFTHMALHYLADPRAKDSPERKAAVASPVRARLAAEPWFRVHATFYTRRPKMFVKGAA